jgi:tetratricopeptide (TPR) repeat protein
MAVLGVFLAAAGLVAQQDPDIENLQHKDPKVREAAATIAGSKKNVRAIPYLIDGLGDKIQDASSACHRALVAITGETIHPNDIPAWKAWWQNVGQGLFPAAAADPGRVATDLDRMRAEMKQEMKEQQDRIEKQMAELRRSGETAASQVQTISIVIMMLGFIFILIMFYFVGHVSSRIKEWKDLMRTADTYVQEAKQITERVDSILDEVDKKKAEVYELFGKMQDEAKDEVGRYADLLQQNSDHRLREEIMELRLKAEKELEGTLAELKTAMGHEMRRLVDGQRERFERMVKEKEDRFQKEADAHRTFLEAGFYAAHGRRDESIRAYQRLLEVDPRNVVGWVKLGQVYLEDKKYDESVAAYKKALDISPSDAKACYSMASLFARLRNKAKMLEYLRQASVHDGEFKDEALNDPAFREYWNDPEFKDVAEG